MTESEVLKSVVKKLKFLELTGDVVWHSRLNSGKININGGWVQLCQAGTPDIISIINCKNGKIAVLFIECKRTGIKKLRYEQNIFFMKMETAPMVLCIVINDPKQLHQAIKKAREL